MKRIVTRLFSAFIMLAMFFSVLAYPAHGDVKMYCYDELKEWNSISSIEIEYMYADDYEEIYDRNLSKEYPSEYMEYIIGVKDDGSVVNFGLLPTNSGKIPGTWKNIKTVSAEGAVVQAVTKDGKLSDTDELSDCAAVISEEVSSVYSLGSAMVVVYTDKTAEYFDDSGNTFPDEDVCFGKKKIQDVAADGLSFYVNYTSGKIAFATRDSLDDDYTLTNKFPSSDIRSKITTAKQIAYSDGILAALNRNGTVTVYDQQNRSAISSKTSKWTGIKQVAVGGGFVLGLKTDGTVVAAGDNSYGQCDVSDWKDIKQIAAGADCTIGVTKIGTLKVANNYTSAGPSDKDLEDIGSVIQRPRAASYYSSYEYKYINAPKKNAINMYGINEGDPNHLIGYATHGDYVTVLAQEGEWACVISSAGKAGWVNANYLSDEMPSDAKATTAKKDGSGPSDKDLEDLGTTIQRPRAESYFDDYEYKYINAPKKNSINMYSINEGYAPYLTTYATHGDYVTVLAQEGEWACVITSVGRAGWVNANYLSDEMPDG